MVEKHFMAENDVEEEDVSVVFELTLKDLTADGKILVQDFCRPADLSELIGIYRNGFKLSQAL